MNQKYLDIVEQERLYFKTVKDFTEVSLYVEKVAPNWENLLLLCHPIGCLNYYMVFTPSHVRYVWKVNKLNQLESVESE